MLDNEQFSPQREQNEESSDSYDQPLESTRQSASKPLNTLYDQPQSETETDVSADESTDSSADTQTSETISAKYSGRSVA